VTGVAVEKLFSAVSTTKIRLQVIDCSFAASTEIR
jgi:hypothetical protein